MSFPLLLQVKSVIFFSVFRLIFVEIIEILNQKFKGKIPIPEIIENRKIFAKFIGLSLFKLGKECLMKFGPNCAIKGFCCKIHRIEGLKEMVI